MGEPKALPPTLTVVTNPCPVISGKSLDQRALESIFDGQPGEFDALLRQLTLRESPPTLVQNED